MGRIKSVSLFMGFLLISAAIFSLIHYGMTHGELVSQVPPPMGFGPYSVGWINRDILKRGGETLPIRVHYPAITPGLRAEPNTTKVPYPTVLFSPGFGTTIDDYSFFATTITSWGFVCVLVGSDPQSLLDVERKNDLIYALDWLDEQNDNSSFKLSQVMDESKFGVLGHSLGGAATIVASLSEPRFKVSVPIAPFLSSGSAAKIHVPILIIVGSRDTVCPPKEMSYPVFEEGNPPKFFLTLEGVNHETIVFMGFKYIVSFLKLYLCEEEGYAKYLYGTAAQQEVKDGKIKLMYDLRVTTQHKVPYNGIQYIILVYSDSTILDVVYNQTLNQINFTIAGPPDTKGTINVSIPRQLVPEAYNINVYFDGESYPFTLTQNSSCYFIFLMYNHSQHQITISFTIQTPSSSLWMEWWFWAIIFVVVVFSVVVVVFRIKRKNVSSVQSSLVPLNTYYSPLVSVFSMRVVKLFACKPL